MRLHPESAKNEVIIKVQKLVVASFFTALFIAFVVPEIIPLVISSATQEPQSTIIRIFIGLATGIFYWWFSANRLNSIVGLAIEAAVDRKIHEYENDNPTVEEVRNALRQEYCCSIPEGVRSKDAIGLAGSSSGICDERAARDAIFIGFAHNEKILQEAALAIRELTLTNNRKYSNVSDKARKKFLADIYTYLRAWLIMSIFYDRSMPVKLIQQRFPHEGEPDPHIYLLAVGNAKKVFHTQKISDCISAEYRQASLKIIDKALDDLVMEIKTAKAMKNHGEN